MRLIKLPCAVASYYAVQAVPLCTAIQAETSDIVLSQFTGVDTSRPALDLAAQNLRQCVNNRCRLSFHENDMLSFLRSSHGQGTYDVSAALDFVPGPANFCARTVCTFALDFGMSR